jgi:hypothetical protein
MLHKYIENFFDINWPDANNDECVCISSYPDNGISLKFTKPFLDLPVGEKIHGELTVYTNGVGIFTSANGKKTFFTMFAGETIKKIDISKIALEETFGKDEDGCPVFHFNVKGHPSFFTSVYPLEKRKNSLVFISALVLSHPDLF